MNFAGSCPLFQVFDMPAALAFYCDLLGFQIESHNDRGSGRDLDWVLLLRGHTELMLNTAYERQDRPPAPDPARIAAHSDTILYFACEDLDAAYNQLHEQGVILDPPQKAAYGMKQLYFHDPDGYALCFQWPTAQKQYDEWVKRYNLPPQTL